ncbi:hypothetical protein STENM327S_08805 [Streptomyces tendae]
MRHPASLSKARPRYDHHEYGPSTSGCSARTTSTYPPSAGSRTRLSHSRSSGRNPEFFLLARQFFRSASRWAMFQSPQTTTSRPSAAARSRSSLR